MNKREIDEMMRHLPSQQPQESLLDKVLIGTMFTVFLIVLCMLPDIMRYANQNRVGSQRELWPTRMGIGAKFRTGRQPHR